MTPEGVQIATASLRPKVPQRRTCIRHRSVDIHWQVDARLCSELEGQGLRREMISWKPKSIFKARRFRRGRGTYPLHTGDRLGIDADRLIRRRRFGNGRRE